MSAVSVTIPGEGCEYELRTIHEAAKAIRDLDAVLPDYEARVAEKKQSHGDDLARLSPIERQWYATAVAALEKRQAKRRELVAFITDARESDKAFAESQLQSYKQQAADLALEAERLQPTADAFITAAAVVLDTRQSAYRLTDIQRTLGTLRGMAAEITKQHGFPLPQLPDVRLPVGLPDALEKR